MPDDFRRLNQINHNRRENHFGHSLQLVLFHHSSFDSYVCITNTLTLYSTPCVLIHSSHTLTHITQPCPPRFPHLHPLTVLRPSCDESPPVLPLFIYLWHCAHGCQTRHGSVRCYEKEHYFGPARITNWRISS